MSFRFWVSIITALILAVIIFFAREDIIQAWDLMSKANLWILLLMIPAQIIVYFAAGEMIFEYLRGKNALQNVSRWSLTRLALEINFVNHALPSGGVSGVSYTGWRLSKMGVSPGRSTMAQVVRYAMGFLSFLVLLIGAVLAVTIDSGVNRMVILVSSILMCAIIGIFLFGIYIIGDIDRLHSAVHWVAGVINRIGRFVTGGKQKKLLSRKSLEHFLLEMHRDYKELLNEKKLLLKPFLWGLVFTTFDIILFVIAFWSLGIEVNFAPLVIAYGLASLAGFIVITPGGAGAYEALMIGFISAAGMPQGAAIAGIVLARTLILLGTIFSGYIFYQLTIWRYGKAPTGR